MERPPLGHRISLRIKRALGMNVFLCDSCRWNWRGACRVPERPNVTYCRDYEKR